MNDFQIPPKRHKRILRNEIWLSGMTKSPQHTAQGPSTNQD